MIYECFTREQIHPRLPSSGTEIRLKAYARPYPGPIEPRGDRWAVLILPGGGYMLTSEREGEPIALSFLAAGMQALVLDYSVFPAPFPQALIEVAACVDFLRRNADKYGIDKIAVCGCSAGGHLAGCFANLWHDPMCTAPLGLTAGAVRPDAAVLCYAVLSALPPLEGGLSFEKLPGSREEPRLSLDTSVTKQNPPAFLWHTASDPTVPVLHSLRYAEALRAAEIPFELHIYPKGPHAMSLATRDTSRGADSVDAHVATWFPLCCEFLEGI